MALKGNQGNLHEAVIDYLIKHMENDFAEISCRQHTECCKGHGREDEISYYQLPVPKDLPGLDQWKALRTLGVAIRQSESAKRSTTEVRYYISSLRLSVKKFAAFVRGHWRIENTLHWCLDVPFREDENRVRDRTLANNLAWLKRFAISLSSRLMTKRAWQ